MTGASVMFHHCRVQGTCLNLPHERCGRQDEQGEERVCDMSSSAEVSRREAVVLTRACLGVLSPNSAFSISFSSCCQSSWLICNHMPATRLAFQMMSTRRMSMQSRSWYTICAAHPRRTLFERLTASTSLIAIMKKHEYLSKVTITAAQHMLSVIVPSAHALRSLNLFLQTSPHKSLLQKTYLCSLTELDTSSIP